MVTIEPIKNQYLTALKERQQIIDKVNEIIRDLNNLNFNDLINLNNKIEEIKTEIVQIENDLSGKVNKNGDTMTGELIANGGLRSDFVRKLNSTGKNIGYVLFEETENSNIGILNASKTMNNGNEINPAIKVFANSDGSYYGTVSSNYIGENDNSEKILNIKMANSLPSLVHTVGNETIAGDKRFTGALYTTNSINFKGNEGISDIIMRRSGTNGVNMSVFIGDTSYAALTINSNGKSIAIGSNTVQAYTGNTPTNATGTEIATAGWVIAKINEFATKNNLAGL